MCVICGLSQSLPLLAVGYTPTQADMEQIADMYTKVQIVAEKEQGLRALEEKVELLRKSSELDTLRKKYMAEVLNELVQYEKIF